MTCDQNGWADTRESERETLDLWERRWECIQRTPDVRIARLATRIKRDHHD